MKKIILTGIVVVLLLLDMAALHDILKGEPDLYGEYGMILFSLIVFASLIVAGLNGKNKIT
ncbi:MAG: hypothetical protein NTV87_15405 [Ignavibacteriae bacterium]|nr:hypothetical protein [Ignavibacteriota bacterium]